MQTNQTECDDINSAFTVYLDKYNTYSNAGSNTDPATKSTYPYVISKYKSFDAGSITYRYCTNVSNPGTYTQANSNIGAG